MWFTTPKRRADHKTTYRRRPRFEALEDRLAPATLVQSTFDADAEGWTFVGDGTGLTHMASGGNPGGFVQTTDRGAGSTWYWAAPAKFLGDQAGAYGGSLLFDLAQSAVTSQFDADDVILLGADQRLVHDLPANPGVDWTSYTVPLEASAWRINSRTGDPASEAQLQTVLGALTALHIRGEYRDGGDTGKLDNVRLEGGSGADLEVTISASPDPVFTGDLLTYTITVTNHGPNDARDVTLTTAVPAHTSFFSFTPRAGGTSTTPAVGGGGTVTSTLPGLAAGGTATFTMQVRAQHETHGEILTLAATVAGATPDPQTTNNTAVDTVQGRLRFVDLHLEHSPPADYAATSGGLLTYFIRLRNLSSVPAMSPSITMDIPEFTTFDSLVAPPGWTVSSPAVGETGTITFNGETITPYGLFSETVLARVVVRVDEGLVSGTRIIASLTASCANPESEGFDNVRTYSTKVDGARTDLSVVITAEQSPAILHPGSIIHWSFLVRNTSPDAIDASAVRVRFDLVRCTLVSATLPNGWTMGFDDVVRTSMLSAGSEALLQVSFEVMPTTTPLQAATISIEASALGLDVSDADNRYEITRTVYAQDNDLRVTINAIDEDVELDVRRYSMTVVNLGGTPVERVVAELVSRIPEQRLEQLHNWFPPSFADFPGWNKYSVGPIPLALTLAAAPGSWTAVEPGLVTLDLGTLAAGGSFDFAAAVGYSLLADNPLFFGANAEFTVRVHSQAKDPAMADNVDGHVSTIDGPDAVARDSSTYYVSEGDGELVVPLVVAANTRYYSVTNMNGSARNVLDYEFVPVVQSFITNDTALNLRIPIFDNPQLDGDRTFRLRLYEVNEFGSNDFLFHETHIDVTIFDDESETPSLTWALDRSGDWSVPFNWNPSFVPNFNDNVVIDVPNTDLTIRIPEGDYVIGSLSSSANLVIEGGSLTITGFADLHRLDIRAGAHVTFASADPVIVRGGLNNAGTLNWSGSGNLNFTAGADLNNLAGGLFRIHTAEPAGAEPAGIVFQGGGSLNNVAGGFIQIDTADPVNGIAGDWNNAGRIAWIGSGSLAFTQGANLNNLAGGLFEIHTAEPAGAEPAGISFSGGGRLRNLAGGVIDVNPAEPAGIRIANLSNDGTVTIRAGALELGAGLSTGRFEIASGAALNFTGNFAWNNGTTFAGAVRVDPAEPAGSTVSVNGNVSMTNLDVGRFGVLQVVGTLTSAGTINVRGTLIGTGTIRGNVRNAGVVRPGRSPGILTIVGDYVQTQEGLLVLEIGGRTPGVQHDQLRVTGLATLAGRVEVVALNGYTPRPSDRIDVLDLARQTGSLAPTNLAFQLLPNGALRPTRLTSGIVTGTGRLRARQVRFRFDVLARGNGAALGALRYIDKRRQIALISTAFTQVQIEATGRRALMQGTALVNGQNGYRFSVWVEDRGRGLVNRDRFRILIEGPEGFRYDSKNPPLAERLKRGDLRVRAL